jgi:hypothetical protein
MESVEELQKKINFNQIATLCFKENFRLLRKKNRRLKTENFSNQNVKDKSFTKIQI